MKLFLSTLMSMLEFIETETINKNSHVPAYVQVAGILKQRISDGTFQPGGRLPSEAAIAERFGISAMTARKAVGLLAEEGLVSRVQGLGTFVKRLKFTASHFRLHELRKFLKDREKLKARIVKAEVEEAGEDLRRRLHMKEEGSVILVERIILHDNEPLVFHVGFARADPESPFVETMLDTDVLTGLFLEEGIPGFKKAELRLLPASLNRREAGFLQLAEGQSVFRLEHVYYDFEELPLAFGWFLIAPEKMPLVCRMGVWNE